MELMDWKQIESNGEEQIRGAKINIVIATLLLDKAKGEIIKLGGQTNDMIRAEEKKKAKKLNDRTTK